MIFISFLLKVQYRLTEGTDAFAINESTGSLSPVRKIDREKETVLRATIMAEDSGIPRQRSYTKVSCNFFVFPCILG